MSIPSLPSSASSGALYVLMTDQFLDWEPKLLQMYVHTGLRLDLPLRLGSHITT